MVEKASVTIVIYCLLALAIMTSGYFSPAGTELIVYFPIALSILLLIPVYVWQKSYRRKTELSKGLLGRDKDTVISQVFVLFTLAMSVRIPSVLLFGEPYEKTPLIYLLVLTILLLEKTDLTAFGFKTKNLRKSLFLGFAFFALLNGLASTIRYVLVYAFTNQMPIQSFDLVLSVSLMPFMTFCVGISEEGLFRGYIQTHLQRFFSSKRAIFIQAALFGVWHFVWNLYPFSPLDMAMYVATTFFIGLLFGYFYSKTKNLIPLIFAHGLWNSLPQSIIQSEAAQSFVSALGLSSQVLMSFLPFVLSALVTVIFIKYYVKEN